MLTVTDDGPGIAEADRTRVTEPGVRLDERGEGHGFGLAAGLGRCAPYREPRRSTAAARKDCPTSCANLLRHGFFLLLTRLRCFLAGFVEEEAQRFFRADLAGDAV